MFLHECHSGNRRKKVRNYPNFCLISAKMLNMGSAAAEGAGPDAPAPEPSPAKTGQPPGPKAAGTAARAALTAPTVRARAHGVWGVLAADADVAREEGDAPAAQDWPAAEDSPVQQELVAALEALVAAAGPAVAAARGGGAARLREAEQNVQAAA